MAISAASFARILSRYFPKGVPPTVVALSGGVDSMCLTHLLAQHKTLYQPDLKLLAVTVDHGLRSESASEARAVAQETKKLGVDHQIATIPTPESPPPNIEEWARHKRLDLLLDAANSFYKNTDHGLTASQDSPQSPHIFLAHNLDEQLETFLLRLRNNSSLYGLGGMRPISYALPSGNILGPSQAPVCLVRPLLEFSKQDIVETCQENNILWFEDPTNKDTRLTERNSLRHIIHQVIPDLVHERPELECLTYASLCETHSKVSALNHYINAQVSRLQKTLKAQDRLILDPSVASLRMILSYEEFESSSTEVLARMLFFNLNPLSSSTHFHWKYLNLLKKLVPQIEKIYRTHKLNFSCSMTTVRLCSLNVDFDITIDDASRAVVLRLSPQTPQAHSICCHPQDINPGEWTLFDNRFWIRVSRQIPSENNPYSTHPKVQIEAYSPSKHRLDFKKVFPLFVHPSGGNIRLEPVITISELGHPKAVHLPTRGLHLDRNWRIECVLKPNLLELTI